MKRHWPNRLHLTAAFALLQAVIGGLAQASVFGDGDPRNGIEDSRIHLASSGWQRPSWQPLNVSSGTIHCDGKLRGSATVVDPGAAREAIDGFLLATSAHVLIDLDTGREFTACTFHYLGLGNLPGYRHRIDLASSRRGAFDSGQSRTSPDFGREDWAFLYVQGALPGPDANARLTPRPFASAVAEQDRGAAVAFHLIGYSSAHESMGISPDCRVTPSAPGDIGGGGWAGHLLDDCDSGAGASGAGLVASVNGEHFLVGIRTGSHWDRGVYPERTFPDGPPAGAPWDARHNTNFSRAIDAQMLDALGDLVRSISRPGQEYGD